MGRSGWDLTWLRVVAFIHYLGNMAVPAEVLAKADVLSEDEREIMDQAKAAVSEDRWTRARTEVRISLPPPSGGGRAATMAVGPYR